MKRIVRASQSSPRRMPDGEVGPDIRSHLSAIVENSNDAIFSRTIHGVITTWNAAAERTFGYSAKEIIGRSSSVLLPPGEHDEYRKLVERIRRGEVVQHYETERVRKDGQQIQVSLTLSPVRDTKKRLIGFSTIARDFTEERRTMEILARREHELQDLFEEASVGIFLTARGGEILRCNRAFLDLLESSSEPVIGRNLNEFHRDHAVISKLLKQLVARQNIHNFSTELLTRDGHLRQVLVDANALWENGRFIQSRWFVRDISRRKELERELLELSERERRGFAQELHDGLGQQLGGVAYLCNVLREKLAEGGAPEAGDAGRIYNLVREAIEHTRGISRGLSPIRPEPDGLIIALRELAMQTTDLFRVNCRFSCRKPVAVEGPSLAGHLYRIAQEAVNNALKHAKPRGIGIRLHCSRGNVMLAVADDGKGIGFLSPTRQGLGLHIMQYRANLIGGTLTVQPRHGGGTEVICTAPCGDSTTPR
jgi:PAS domain S-box-containing protein